MFIGYGTWKWLDVHLATGDSPVYRYSFDRDRPIAPDTKVNGITATAKDIGARHAGEIEYVFGALSSDAKAAWEPIDTTISEQMMSYWTNFAKTGTPNGPGLPKWPTYKASDGYQVMHIAPQSEAAADATRPRYLVLDQMAQHARTDADPISPTAQCTSFPAAPEAHYRTTRFRRTAGDLRPPFVFSAGTRLARGLLVDQPGQAGRAGQAVGR